MNPNTSTHEESDGLALSLLIGNPLKVALAVLLPFIALILQLSMWTWVQPYIWFFFYPAVFLSAWLGGLVGGLAATAISVVLVVYFFIEPIPEFGISEARYLGLLAMFAAMGSVFAIFHQRLRVSNARVAQALKDTTASESRFRAMFETTEGAALSFPTRQQLSDARRTDESASPHFINEKEFRLLADSVPHIVWITGPDGKNIFFNQQWIDYTGLTMAESYGDGWNKPLHPDDRHPAWEAWQNAIRHHGPYALECRLRRADGAYRWWLVRGVPALGVCRIGFNFRHRWDFSVERPPNFVDSGDSRPNIVKDL